jgi:serine/threonine-protein kinase
VATASQTVLPAAGGQLGRYELLDELGEGGMATVFAARDPSLRREVAIKVLFPHLAKRADGVARFHREARAAAKLDHPHILRVLDVGGGMEAEPPYIVLELITGPSLDHFFADREPPLAEVVAAVGVNLCEALAVAHEAGIVHRDVKPANILLAEGGRLVLGDFGVARVSEEDSVVTQTGALLGTPAFMSPEQAQGEKIDFRSDLYSVGATLYAIGTGSMPFEGNSAKVISALLAGKKVPAEQRRPELGRDLSRLLDQLMSLRPEERGKSAREVSEKLQEIVQSGGFEDADELLQRYFSEQEEPALRAVALRSTLQRAASLQREGRRAAALSAANRVLAMDAENAQAEALAKSLARPGKRRLWPAIVLPMIAAAALGTVFWGKNSVPPSTYADAGISDAFIPIDAAPTPAEASLDAGVTKAITLMDAAPAPRKTPPPRRLRADAAPVNIDAAIAPATAPPKVVRPAKVRFEMSHWCDASIDGVSYGRADKKRWIEVVPGPHEFRCHQPTTGEGWSAKRTLAEGQEMVLSGQVLAAVRVEVKTSAAAVRIGGRLLRSGDRASLAAGRYEVEILEGKKVVNSGFLSLRQSCVLRDKPAISCARR